MLPALAFMVLTMFVLPTALMVFAISTAAFMVISMAATATLVLIIVMMPLTIGIAILAITVATTTTGACTHLLLHALRHLFICRSLTLFNGKAKVLINGRKKLVELLASLKETAAGVILHNILTQSVKLGNFFL